MNIIYQYFSTLQKEGKIILLSFLILAFSLPALAQPSLSSPTEADVTSTTATLGGTVVSGTGITEVGTVWLVGSTPSIGDNKDIDGGNTSTGAFTHGVTGLTPKSQIFYAPYAIDGVGTTVGASSSFYTLANEPGTIGTFSSTGQTTTTIDLDWVSASSGAFGYLIYMNPSSTAPTPGLTDGLAPTGSPEANITTPASTSTTISSLTRYTEYSFTIITYDYDGTNAATYNYRAPVTLTSIVTLEEASTVSTPTATAISNTTATLGGTVDDDGGNVLTERGTIWKVGSAPAIGDNKAAEGGTTSGTFTDARTGLTPKSNIYYAPYAINAIGTTIGTGDNFYTLANEPGAIGTFSSTGQTTTTIDLDWVSASSGAFGYLIYMNPSSTAPTPGLTDGLAPTGSPEANITTPASTSTTISSLTRYTEYSFTIITYDYDGTNAATYNYRAPVTLTSIVTLEEASTVSTPTATAISNTTATLGGTVDDDGGNVLTERGTIWKVGSAPAIGDNKAAEGGTTSGTFTDARTGLPSKSNIYYAPYAINAIGTTIGTGDNFYTLGNDPGTIATLTSPSQSATIDLSWTASSNATGYLIYRSTGSTPPNPTLTDGSAPTGSPIADVSILNHTVTSLAAFTEYSFTVIPYDKGAVDATYNYGPAKTLPSISTTCDAPSTQASGVSFTAVTAGNLNINWTPGNGDGTLIIVREDNAVNEIPNPGTSYTADLDLDNGNGTDLNNGNIVVYKGSSSPQILTGLSASTTYHFAFYEFNTTDNCYNLISAPTASVSTISAADNCTIESGSGPATISSLVNTESTQVVVFNFTLNNADPDGDDLTAEFSELRFTPGPGN